MVGKRQLPFPWGVKTTCELGEGGGEGLVTSFMFVFAINILLLIHFSKL